MPYHASVKGQPNQDGLTVWTEETVRDFLDRRWHGSVASYT